jgi:hypothetical protein
MQRKFKFLTLIVTTALVVALVLASAGPAIGSWIDHSVVSITSGAATTGITTTVVGLDTNAFQNPIDINGQLYTMSGGNAPNSIGEFNTGPIASDPKTLISTASISASGFVPGDYALFQVTIKNTGSTILQFSDYTVLCEFVDSSGNAVGYTFPVYNEYGGTYEAAKTGPVYSGIISGFWDTAGTQSDMTTQFLTYFQPGNSAGCENTWCADNALIGSTAPTSGQTLGNGATFVYYIYIGLGGYTAPGIPTMLYTVDIPLTVAQ